MYLKDIIFLKGIYCVINKKGYDCYLKNDCILFFVSIGIFGI